MTTPVIVFEDGEGLVIDKPAGLAVDQPRAGGPSLTDHLDALKLGFQRLPTPVHRLDTDTSGCLLLARNPKALKRFAAAFAERSPEKSYIGLVAGSVADDSGTIDLSLAKISSKEKGWRMIAAKKGKPSITHWEKLAELTGATLLRFRPETGRTHQIRIHALAGLGAPLLGDPVYGNGKGAPRHDAARFVAYIAARGKTANCRDGPPARRFPAAGRCGRDGMDERLIDRAHALAEESFLAGSGPGGQNANKVATSVQLRVNAYALRLPPEVFRRLRDIAGSKLTNSGDLLIMANAHRTQDANRAEAREKLQELLENAHRQPRRRAKTRLNRVNKRKRLAKKKERGQVKAGRGKIEL